MSAWSWIFLVIVVMLLIAMLLARRANAGVDPTQLLLDPELVARVRGLAQQQHQQAAVKLLRDGTPGLGLASARVMVDRMARPRGDVAAGPLASGVPPEVEAEARSLKSSGDVIAAIKLARAHLPDLRQAKDYVDGL